MVEMTTVEFGSVAGSWSNLDANFLAFTSTFNRFVIHFDVRDDSYIHKLMKKKSITLLFIKIQKKSALWNDWPTGDGQLSGEKNSRGVENFCEWRNSRNVFFPFFLHSQKKSQALKKREREIIIQQRQTEGPKAGFFCGRKDSGRVENHVRVAGIFHKSGTLHDWLSRVVAGRRQNDRRAWAERGNFNRYDRQRREQASSAPFSQFPHR